MKTIMNPALLSLLASTALCSDFTLHQLDTTNVLGPFFYRHGEILQIGTNSYEISQISTKASETRERLKRVIIPSIEFRNAVVPDVLNFLIEASSRRPDDVVNIAPIGLCINSPAATNDPAAVNDFGDSFGWPTASTSIGKTITLNLQRITLYDAIDTISKVLGVDFWIDDNGVVFFGKKGPNPSENQSILPSDRGASASPE